MRCCVACPAECWVMLRGRSLQCWGRTPHAPHGQPAVASDTVQPGMPAWLKTVMQRVEQSGVFAQTAATPSPLPLLPRCPPPDHVLINRYEAGQGIMAHKDGPAYQPLVAILSLSSHTVMHFYHQPPPSTVCVGEEHGQPLLTLLLEPRSLLLFTDELYTSHYHCIHGQSEDILTPRDIHNWQQLSSRQQWDEQSGSCDRPLHLTRSTRLSLTIRASNHATA